MDRCRVLAIDVVTPNSLMTKVPLRTASIWCLAIWAAMWCLFILIRVFGFDIRIIPGIGPILLGALAVAIFAPVIAVGIAATSLIRRPRTAVSWLILGCAVAACLAVGYILAATRWL